MLVALNAIEEGSFSPWKSLRACAPPKAVPNSSFKGWGSILPCIQAGRLLQFWGSSSPEQQGIFPLRFVWTANRKSEL